MTVEVEIAPASPAPKDGVLITIRGACPEGSTVRVTSDTVGANTAISPVFGQNGIPEGTGPEAVTLQVLGGTFGEFSLVVMDPESDPADAIYYETDPVYYASDAPTYAFPDEDEVEEALLDAVPDGVTVETRMVGNLMTILFGGIWSGKQVNVSSDAAIGGAETITIADVEKIGGPFQFGPLFLNEGDYEVDVVDEDSVSLLGSVATFTVAE